jgi:hypothetical protein
MRADHVSTKPATSATSETTVEHERLLSQLRPADRRLVEDVLANHPGLTAAEAIEFLRAFGGL